jgi:uncharacterized membrane-anchored protein YhcB (DUF1043 family)
MRVEQNTFDDVLLNWFEEDDDKDGEDTNVKTAEGKGKEDEIKDDEVEEILSKTDLTVLVKKQSKDKLKLAGIARDRLHEVMEKKNKLKEIEKKEAEEKEKSRIEKEEYKNLYEEAKPKLDALEKYTAETLEHFNEEFETLKTDLPSEYHSLIPDVDIRKKIAWVKNFNKTVVTAKAKKEEDNQDNDVPPKRDVGSGNTGDGRKKSSAKNSMEDQIKGCKNMNELNALIAGYGATGK